MGGGQNKEGNQGKWIKLTKMDGNSSRVKQHKQQLHHKITKIENKKDKKHTENKNN